jgi:hypothetical protein
VREVAFVRKLITCLLVALTFGSVISFQSVAIAGDACVSRAEFRAAERGMRIRQVQHNFGTAGRVSNRNGSELGEVLRQVWRHAGHRAMGRHHV